MCNISATRKGFQIYFHIHDNFSLPQETEVRHFSLPERHPIMLHSCCSEEERVLLLPKHSERERSPLLQCSQQRCAPKNINLSASPQPAPAQTSSCMDLLLTDLLLTDLLLTNLLLHRPPPTQTSSSQTSSCTDLLLHRPPPTQTSSYTDLLLHRPPPHRPPPAQTSSSQTLHVRRPSLAFEENLVVSADGEE